METSGDLRKTPLYESHLLLQAKMAPFGGWLMPIQYRGILAEHAHTRQEVSVFDICHMGEFMLGADPATSSFDRIITQDVVSMPLGSCRYGFMLDEEGGIIDDLIVYRLYDKNWMLVVNAATTAGDESQLYRNLSGGCCLKNVSSQLGKLDVQGPLSRDVLAKIFGDSIARLGYYSCGEFFLWGERCIVSRTGYTGELGYEVYIPLEKTQRLWDTLLKDHRVKPAGLGSRDTLRLEMGYPLYGQDIDAQHTPLAAGLERFVDFSKDFIGKRALLKEREAGPKERLVCLVSDARRAPRHGFGIFDGDRRVGTVTSGSFSPSLSVGIAMGYVSGNYRTGERLFVRETAVEIPVRVTKKPFYRKTTL
ncbi:MAG: glycine cleavage system aminomethyltransferase GcvT [Candidatus Omnitrophota bacterium]